MKKVKLVLGSAGKNDPEAVTVDIDARHNPDVIHDLNRIPWPFKDSEFKTVVCHHVLEHLNFLSPAMKELHRICAPDGAIHIEVPHFSSWMANSPEHRLRFSYFSLNAYLSKTQQYWHITDFKFRLLEQKITFHRSFRRFFLHRLWNRFPLAYERFWTYIFPAEHLIFRIQPIK